MMLAVPGSSEVEVVSGNLFHNEENGLAIVG